MASLAYFISHLSTLPLMPSKSDYEQALELIEELNPSAHVLAKAQQKIRDPNVEISDLEDILRSDPGITTDILRLSNSAYYSYATPAKDLATAISRIGLDELLKLVGLSVSKNVMAQDLMHYDMSAVSYWSEGVSTALFMEVLARFIGAQSSEAYTIGLLSCIGKLVIDQILEIFGEEDIYDGGVPLPEWEKSVLGFDHAFAGAMMLKRWDFPEEITGAILYQFKPEKAEESSDTLKALSFARKMIAQTGYDFKSDNIEIDEEMEQFIADFYIDEEDLVNGLVDAAEKFAVVKRELGVN